MNRIVKVLFFMIDPLHSIKQLKSFRGVMVVYIILCFMIGHMVITTAKEYIPIAWHKIFKDEVMEKKAPIQHINSDLPIPNTEIEHIGTLPNE